MNETQYPLKIISKPVCFENQIPVYAKSKILQIVVPKIDNFNPVGITGETTGIYVYRYDDNTQKPLKLDTNLKRPGEKHAEGGTLITLNLEKSGNMGTSGLAKGDKRKWKLYFVALENDLNARTVNFYLISKPRKRKSPVKKQSKELEKKVEKYLQKQENGDDTTQQQYIPQQTTSIQQTTTISQQLSQLNIHQDDKALQNTVKQEVFLDDNEFTFDDDWFTSDGTDVDTLLSLNDDTKQQQHHQDTSIPVEDNQFSLTQMENAINELMNQQNSSYRRSDDNDDEEDTL